MLFISSTFWFVEIIGFVYHPKKRYQEHHSLDLTIENIYLTMHGSDIAQTPDEVWPSVVGELKQHRRLGAGSVFIQRLALGYLDPVDVSIFSMT